MCFGKYKQKEELMQGKKLNHILTGKKNKLSLSGFQPVITKKAYPIFKSNNYETNFYFFNICTLHTHSFGYQQA
jgi:hypothetical protein